MIARLLLIAVLCVPSMPLAADDSTQANRLLVEAVKLIQAAGTKQTRGRAITLGGKCFRQIERNRRKPSLQRPCRQAHHRPAKSVTFRSLALPRQSKSCRSFRNRRLPSQYRMLKAIFLSPELPPITHPIRTKTSPACGRPTAGGESGRRSGGARS